MRLEEGSASGAADLLELHAKAPNPATRCTHLRTHTRTGRSISHHFTPSRVMARMRGSAHARKVARFHDLQFTMALKRMSIRVSKHMSRYMSMYRESERTAYAEEWERGKASHACGHVDVHAPRHALGSRRFRKLSPSTTGRVQTCVWTTPAPLRCLRWTCALTH